MPSLASAKRVERGFVRRTLPPPWRVRIHASIEETDWRCERHQLLETHDRRLRDPERGGFFAKQVWSALFRHDTLSLEKVPYGAGSQISPQHPPSSRLTFPIHRPFRHPSRVRRKPREARYSRTCARFS